MKTNFRPLRQEQGVALIEGMIAILIFSLGILGLIGLQATASQSTTLAKSRIDASFAASQRIAEIWGDVGNIANMQNTTEYISTSAIADGRRITEFSRQDDGTYQVTVRVTWALPSDATTEQSYTTVARIVGN